MFSYLVTFHILARFTKFLMNRIMAIKFCLTGSGMIGDFNINSAEFPFISMKDISELHSKKVRVNLPEPSSGNQKFR